MRAAVKRRDAEGRSSVRLRLERRQATAELDLGDEARFWPSDEALARWKSIAEGGEAAIVYE